MPFEKGFSGNPSGRAKKTDEQIKFERRCREWADTMGFDKLKRWADSDEASKSIEALKEIFNRGFGKSVETSIVDAYVAPIVGSSVEELAGELASFVGGETPTSIGVASQGQVDGGK